MSQLKVFDIVIVGGGAAGCVLARRLSETGQLSVLLLEAGPDLGRNATPELRDGWRLPSGAAWSVDWGLESEPDELGASRTLRRGRALGGTSWLTRFAVRGAAADFDTWAAKGNPGWTFQDVLPSFRRIESDVEFGHDPWHGIGGPLPIMRYPDLPRADVHVAALEAFGAAGFPAVDDHNHPTAVGIGPMPMSTRNGRRVTTLDGFLRAGQRPANLTVRTDSPVARVVIDSGRATAVQLADGTQIGADWIVLAAGTYGSPTLLMRSGVGPADHLHDVGVAVRLDLPGVGSNLADHPAVELDTGWRGSGTDGPILHSIATFRSSIAASNGAPDLLFWISDPDAADPGFWLDPILLKPHSRGTVRLRSAQPNDPPRITLPGLREAVDVERLAEGYRRGLDLAASSPIRRLAMDAPPGVPRRAGELRRRVVENAYSLPHVVGTCAMGPSPEDGAVVDALGRVHGVEHLSVIDASIIPEAPAGFPHLITIMLAEHLAGTASALR
ncbi:MAG: FAD-dependent oxidoreductase [Candidatus Limnocylindrales bacterium]